MSSPTQRTLEYLRKQGYEADVVERWISGHRKDLFGCIDVVAVRLGRHGALAVQTTSAGNMSSRLKKVRESRGARLWVLSGCALHVHGWKKVDGRWKVIEVKFTHEDFPEPGEKGSDK